MLNFICFEIHSIQMWSSLGLQTQNKYITFKVHILSSLFYMKLIFQYIFEIFQTYIKNDNLLSLNF